MQFFWLDKEPPTKECKLLFEASILGKIKQFKGKPKITNGLSYVSGYVFEVATTETPKIDKIMEYDPSKPKDSPFIRKTGLASPIPNKKPITVWIYKANEKLRPDLIH